VKLGNRKGRKRPMNVHAEPLRELVHAIFVAAGSEADEAAIVSDHLIAANLAGHDSHGVIRIPTYIRWVDEGMVLPNQIVRTVFENEAIAVLDGCLGYGQVVGTQSTELALSKCARYGVAVVALRNAGHVGRLGHYAEMCAQAGKVSLHFVNTNGMGVLVAPTGGVSRRLSANPLAAGIPDGGGSPIILDFSTSAIAGGKIHVALNRGVPVPEGCILDSSGRPTTDPKDFFADPPGALLPFGGHKGYGLSVIVDILAGALTGGGCTGPGKDRLEQGMLSIVLDPDRFAGEDFFGSEIGRFVAYLKDAKRASPDAEILVPGEPEQRARAQRRKQGVPLDDKTWSEIREVCARLKIAPSIVDSVGGAA
jgi:uncharacterized oxidoreductase